MSMNQCCTEMAAWLNAAGGYRYPAQSIVQHFPSASTLLVLGLVLSTASSECVLCETVWCLHTLEDHVAASLKMFTNPCEGVSQRKCTGVQELGDCKTSL